MLESLQQAASEIGRASAFGAWKGAAGDGVSLRERQGLAIIELAAFSRSETVRETLSQTLGVALPKPGLSSETGGIAALSTGPARWLLIAPEGTAAGLPAPPEDMAGMIDLSHGRAILSISGANAVRTLMKGTAIDLDPEVFVPGAVAVTALARVPVVIWRRGNIYDVIVARSYAVTILEWLTAAGGLA